MGGQVCDLDMHFNIFSITLLYDVIPDVVLQTMTATFKFPKPINLYMLNNLPTTSRYNPELFPALQLLDYKPVSVNVFASGKVTICGLKDIDFAVDIIKDLTVILSCLN